MSLNPTNCVDVQLYYSWCVGDLYSAIYPYHHVIIIAMVTGVFTSLVSVLERSVPVPDGDTTHRSPLATSLLQIISALITHNKELYVL